MPTGRPIRTCIGCRQRADPAELLRIVWSPDVGGPVADLRRRAPGRGAYLHPAADCLAAAVRRRAAGRALRVDTGVDPAALVAAVEPFLTEDRRPRGETTSRNPGAVA